jgi:hypothetical protein
VVESTLSPTVYSPFPAVSDPLQGAETPEEIAAVVNAVLYELPAPISTPAAREEFATGSKHNSGWPGPQPHSPMPSSWPAPMADAAFYGLAGEWVRLVEPETEADPAALLVTFLVGFGAAIGRGPHYQVEDTRHFCNLNAVLVGDTSKARKGTATDRAVRILEALDPDFIRTRKRSGLSSGEGLIQAVRDAREEDVEVKEKGGPKRFERQVVDAGESDKRLWVIESEFGQTLQASGREGNILSAVLRDAWDGKPLAVMARSNKDRCQEPHIAVTGNITIEELHRLLTSTDKANGFGNRILWCCARRSKLLPFGGNPPDPQAWHSLVNRLKAALEAARRPGRVEFDPEARKAWAQAYPALTEGAEGLFGSMTARAEAQVVRLAMIYALLDCSRLIRLPHLAAGLEVWGYCEESVRCIFGDQLGDETADAILGMLRSAPNGMSATELSGSFGRHKSAAELQRALGVLRERGAIACSREETGGKPVTRWTAAKKAN